MPESYVNHRSKFISMFKLKRKRVGGVLAEAKLYTGVLSSQGLPSPSDSASQPRSLCTSGLNYP